MKTTKMFCRSAIASFFVAFAMTVSVMAADMRPAVVISIADIDTAVKNLKAVTTEAGFPDAMSQAEMMLPVLEGMNIKQPIGIVILADDESFSGYACLPIADISAMQAIAPMLDTGEKQSDGSILVPMMSPFLPNVYVKQSGKWAFISPTELPKNLPSDPVKLLEGMDKQYLLGVKVNVANLPKQKCLDGLAQFRAMAEMSAKSESDLESIEASFQQFERLLDELKTFSYCIGVNSANDIIIETSAEAVSGTVLAADYQSLAGFKTNQLGFYQPEESVLAVMGTGVLNAMVKQQYISQLNGFFEGAREGVEEGDLGPDEIAAAQSVLDNVKAMLDSTLEKGKVDIGITWKKNATVLAGLTVEDGAKFQQALEKSIVGVPEEFQEFVTLNSDEYDGYKISTVAVPTTVLPPEAQEGMSDDLASRTLTLQIAVKDTAVALALGLDDKVLDDLKKAIDDSKTPAAVPETVFVLTPANLVDFFTLIGPTAENESYEQMMDMVRSIPPNAQMIGTTVYAENTQKGKLVVSNQLLPTIGKMIESFMETRNAAMQFGRDYYEDEEEIEIEEFDF